ncbi:MAG: NADH-quinone oxidoreductase subunit J [Planctomycetales bacterium]|nr:NADH-quinone oxidoreductase subunit J [Planctomycetales bacterium]
MSTAWLPLAATITSLSNFAREMVTSPFAWAVVLAFIGAWLLLPKGPRRGRRLGIAVSLASLALFGWIAPRIGGWLDGSVFLAMSALTIVAALATVTSRDPVYSAIWFGVVLLGTSSLFLYQGAQFLGVATVVVYAGAILVTFLFVLMLAQPEGHAYYDRISWEACVSAGTAAVFVGLMVGTVTRSFEAGSSQKPLQTAAVSAADRATGILHEEHVATLGARIYSQQLVAVEAAGVLLLAALVGAVAIVEQGKKTPAAPAGQSSLGGSSNA